MWKVTILALLTSAFTLHARQLAIVEGGVSPNKKLAIAVVPQKPGEFIDEADTTVYLIDNKTKKPIGPLEEVDSGGGTWGKPTENISASWSRDGRHVIVNYRAGRLMSGSQLYRVPGRRAVPITLPKPEDHPKGKVLEVAEPTANPGARLGWKDNQNLILSLGPYMPKKDHWEDHFKKLGFPEFGPGYIFEIHYHANKDGAWKLVDIR